MACVYRKLESSLDRFQEAHFWIHKLGEHYHFADPFRWHLNAFLKALNEIPQLLKMELQGGTGFKTWFRMQEEKLNADPLIHFLSKKRNMVVHRRMLLPRSAATVGLTEGRGIKIGCGTHIDPFEDSDRAIERYLQHDDFLSILMPDEESTPCVHRIWKLEEFDEELLELCILAWKLLGRTVTDTLVWLDEETPPLPLECKLTYQQVEFKLYSRAELAKWLENIRSE